MVSLEDLGALFVNQSVKLLITVGDQHDRQEYWEEESCDGRNISTATKFQLEGLPEEILADEACPEPAECTWFTVCVFSLHIFIWNNYARLIHNGA